MIRDTNTNSPLTLPIKPCYYSKCRTLDYFWSPSFGQPQEFPIDAVPPDLFVSTKEAFEKFKAPPELIFASQMSTLSTAAQSSHKVLRHNGIETPVSLFFLSIAESGLRKTSIDRHFTAVLDNPDLFYPSDNITSFNAKDEQTQKVAKSPRRKIKYSDSTPEALMKGLSQWPTAFLHSNEAGSLLNSRTSGNLSSWNALWDGQHLEVDRIDRDSFTLQDARLSLSLMVQPQTFNQFLKKRGKLSRDNGFLARCLHANVNADLYIGQRFEEYSINHTVGATYQDGFNDRIIEIIKQGLTVKGDLINKSITMKFDGKARVVLINFNNDIEELMQNGFPLVDIRDAASKAVDNMARLAALLHIYKGEYGDIDESTVNRSIDIMRWYLNSFKCLYGQRVISQFYISDAQILKNWIFDLYCKNPANHIFSRRTMRQNCPNVLRQDRRFDAALNELCIRNEVGLIAYGKTNYITLNTSCFQHRAQRHTSYPTQVMPALGQAFGVLHSS
jgi:Protein of unknown function (DUF3987)